MKEYPTNKGMLNSTINYERLIKQQGSVPKQYIATPKKSVGITSKPQGPKTSIRLVLRPGGRRGGNR